MAQQAGVHRALGGDGRACCRAIGALGVAWPLPQLRPRAGNGTDARRRGWWARQHTGTHPRAGGLSGGERSGHSVSRRAPTRRLPDLLIGQDTLHAPANPLRAFGSERHVCERDIQRTGQQPPATSLASAPRRPLIAMTGPATHLGDGEETVPIWYPTVICRSPNVDQQVLISRLFL